MHSCVYVLVCACVCDSGCGRDIELCISLTSDLAHVAKDRLGARAQTTGGSLGPFPGSQDSPLIAPMTIELLDISLSLSTHFTLLQDASAVLRPSPPPPRAGKARIPHTALCSLGPRPGAIAITAEKCHPDPKASLPSSGPQEATGPGGVSLWFRVLETTGGCTL